MGTSGIVEALSIFDDQGGGGPALYAGGGFSSASGVSVSNIAKWDGSSWSAFASGFSGPVRALWALDGRTGGAAALYVGGTFTGAGGILVNSIAKWDGTSWSPLGSG